MLKIPLIISYLLILPIQFTVFRYNYSYYGDVIHSAPGMNYATHFNEQTLQTSMNSPEDMVVYDNLIYIVSSTSDNLVIVNDQFEHVKTYSFFRYSEFFPDELIPVDPEPIPEDPDDEDEIENPPDSDEEDELIDSDEDDEEIELPEEPVLTLRRPQGIEVKSSGIYIADTGHGRIVKLNHDFEVIEIFDAVDDITFEGVVFEPIKLTVDSTGRMYVVARNIFEGVIELDIDGSFNRYVGVNPIKLTPWDILVRSWMTETQLARLPRYLPTEYTNVSMTDHNFVFATAQPSTNNQENMIQLINPKGVDVLRRNGYHIPLGDIHFMTESNNYVIEGPSQLVDVAMTDNGIYTVLDQKRSRLFTYDREGNLLYINGDSGAQSDKFTEGVAIAYLNDDLLILDRNQRTVVVYRLTDFGRKVNQAVMHQEIGNFDEAAAIWEEVIMLNTNYEVAYNGIGRYHLRNGNYEEAISYFKFGHDRFYYSKAYQAYRNQIIKDNFGWIMGLSLLVVGGFIGFRVYRSKKRRGLK